MPRVSDHFSDCKGPQTRVRDLLGREKTFAGPSDTEGQEVNPSHCRQLRREGVPAPPSAIILKAGQLAGVRSYKGPSVRRELSPVFPRFTTSLNFLLYKPTELTRVWDTLQKLLPQNASFSQLNSFVSVCCCVWASVCIIGRKF